MTDSPINVAVLGSTGSIGTSTLEVIGASAGRIKVVSLSTYRRVEDAIRQSCEHHPKRLVVADPDCAQQHDFSALPTETELVTGPDGLVENATAPEVHVVVAAIVGSAALQSTWAALEAGKTVALANKETLVAAGPLATRLAADRGARIVPIDSEHSALFQALQAGRREDVRRVILTASGGPFRQYSQDQLANVTVEQALEHPPWNMGPNITVDSATMMNKALEIIEARWLFQLRPDQIDVVIHPQSIVHSMVEDIDGSVMAQLSPPDMKLPIQYALTFPQRWPGPATRMDWHQLHTMEFGPPDFDRFPALKLGLEVAMQGGTAGAVLNAANEAAVACFLESRLAYHDIVPACRAVLEHHDFESHPTLQRVLEIDQWARKEIEQQAVA